MIIYFKNQTELAGAINKTIDSYWDEEIKEEKLVEILLEIQEKNKELLYKDDDFSAVVKQRIGIKRLRILENIIENK